MCLQKAKGGGKEREKGVIFFVIFFNLKIYWIMYIFKLGGVLDYSSVLYNRTIFYPNLFF